MATPSLKARAASASGRAKITTSTTTIFSDIDDRPLFLQNEDSDRLDNINVAFNTIINCDEVRLGGNGGDPPTNVTFANNIFADPKDDLFDDPTGNESWIGNLAFGGLGITHPASGLAAGNPQLEENADGFFGLAAGSPAINAALTGYAALPQFPGMEPIDTDVLFDLMGQARPASVTQKDLGANEFPHNVVIRPIATEENTGPDYNSSIVSVTNGRLVVADVLSVFPNPASKEIVVTVAAGAGTNITVDLFDMTGKHLSTLVQSLNAASETTISQPLDSLPAGMYTLWATGLNQETSGPPCKYRYHLAWSFAR